MSVQAKELAVNGGASAAPGGWRSVVRGNVLAMGLVSLFTDFSSEMMNPLLPIFIAGLVGGLEAAAWVGLTEGIAETTAAILKIFSGRISDRTGKRKALVVLGYGASSVARPLMAIAGLAGAAWAGVQVVVLKFFDRVGKGIRTSPRDALIGDSVGPGVRGLAFSFHRSMDHFGAVAGPAVAIVVLACILGERLWSVPAIETRRQAVGPDEMSALRWLFALAILPGLAAMAAAVFKVREIAPKPKASPNGQGQTVQAQRLPGRFYAFVGIVTLFALGNSSDMFIVLLAATRFELSLLGLLCLWILLHVSKIAFSIPGGVLSDKIGRRPVIVGGWLVYALVYCGLAFAWEQWQFWALMVAYGGFFGMTEGSEKALVTDFVPSERRGTAFGIYHGAVGLAAFPASLVFGVLWTVLSRTSLGEAGAATVVFGIGAGLAAMASVMLTVLLSASRQEVQKQG